MTRTPARLGAALITAAFLAVAAPAAAHVGVSSTDAAQGGFGKIVFRVPNESDTAATTKLVVTLPADTPFAFVSAGSKPGWTVEVVKAQLDAPTKVGDYELTEAVSTITWTATEGGTPVGQFDEFEISGGPFPEAADMSFAAAQSYDDGEVVDWAEEQTGDTEPEHPAPVLTLSEPTDGGHHGASDDTEEVAQATSTDDDTGTDTAVVAATVIGAAALVVAVAALVVALRQNRRRA
ncbi:MAG: YcnI family protein [Aeromicrobium sp.]